MRPGFHPEGRDRKSRFATSTASCCRRRSYLHEKEKIEKRWPAAVQSSFRTTGSTNSSPATPRISASCCRAACTTPRSARWNCSGLSDAFGNSARSALRAERHLSAGGCGDHSLLRRQERDADDRGRPAGLHRAEPATPSCAARTSRPRSTARTCCRWPANTPAAVMREGIAEVHRAYAPRADRPRAPAARWSVRPSTGLTAHRKPRTARCMAARRRSAPAARNGRSSPR